MKWLADENFRNAIIRGVLRRSVFTDVVRAQDIPQVSGENDLKLLSFATDHGRIVLTHDVTTIIPAMRDQIAQSGYCAPIVLVPDSLPVHTAIEDILLLDECGSADDWASGVLYLPLR